MTTRIASLFSAALLLVSQVTLVTASYSQDNAVTLAPHQAVYDLRLDEAKPSSGIVGISGRLVYELSGSACQGYALESRFVLNFDHGNDDIRTVDILQTSFETAERDAFDFSNLTLVNDKPTKQLRGSAFYQDEALTIELKEPVAKDVEHSGDIYFPVSHMKSVLESAKKSEVFRQIPLFNGSDNGDEVDITSVTIGRAKEDVDRSVEGGEALENSRLWPVTMRYFKPDDRTLTAAAPYYSIKMDLFENGIVGNFSMKYSDFSLNGTVVKLIALPQETCE